MTAQNCLRSFQAIVLVALGCLAFATPARAQLTWDANGTLAGQTNGAGAWLGTNLWWNGGSNQNWASGSDAIFGGLNTAGGAVTLASPTTIGSLTFNQFTGTYTLGTAGQTITINGGINKTSSSAAVTFVSGIALGGNQTWTNSSSNALSTPSSTNFIDTAGYQLTIDGTGNTTFGTINSNNVTIIGSGDLVKNGTGVLSIGGLNSGYSGNVFINDGILRFTNNAGGLGSGNISLNGGVLENYWGQTLTRNLGAGVGEIQILGSASGFSENGSGQSFSITFNNSSNYEAVWGSAYFNPSALVLAAATAQGTGTGAITNRIDLNGATRTVQVAGGTLGTAIGNLSGIIRNTSDTAAGLIKTGAGKLNLTGTNTFAGTTTISAGILQIGNALALQNSALNTTDSVIGNASNGLQGLASFTLGGLTGINNLADVFTTGTGAYSTVTSLTLNPVAGASHSYSGAIANGAAGMTLAKTGVGTQTFSGANSYTGTTTLSGGGSLVLDFSPHGTSMLSDSAALILGASNTGSKLTLKGSNAYTEVVSATTLNAGGSAIVQDGSNILRMKVITRAAGATLSFSAASIADTDTSNVNDILGGWATIGNNWATSAVGAADTPITALSSYTPFVNSGGSAATNFILNGGDSLGGALAANTVKITNSGNSQTLSLGSNNLTITSTSATSLGGLMYAGGNDDLYTISGGTGRIVTSTANQELIFAVNTGTLTVSALVGASGSTGGVTKFGAGRMEISSNNNFTGAVRVNEGVLRLAHANATGTSGGGIFVQNGAALELTGGITVVADALTITGTGIANGGALRNLAGSNNTYQGTITIGAGGARINADSGTTLNLRGIVTALNADVTFGGDGEITHSTTAISGAGTVIKNGAGILNFNVANTYTGGTILNSGDIQIGVNNALADTGIVTVKGGTFAIGGFSDTVLAVTLENGNITGSTGILTGTAGYQVQSGNISAILGGNGGLAKTTSGTVTLTNTNIYQGQTMVSQGTLLVNGSGSTHANSAVMVNGGTLGGTGTINGAMTLNPGGKIAPGNSIGQLNGNSLTWNSNDVLSGMSFELSSIDSTSDIINLSGAFTKGSGNTFLFDFTGGLAGQSYLLMLFSSTDFTVSDFAVGSGIAGTFTLNGNSLEFTAVPEPSSYVLAAIGLVGLGLLVAVRRRGIRGKIAKTSRD